MWLALCFALLCSCGISSSEVVGHYDLTCDGTDAGWLEIATDLTLTLDPSEQPHLAEQHVTAHGDEYQVDVTTHTILGEGGYVDDHTNLELAHDGGTGTRTTAYENQPTPTVTCASLVAKRGVSP